MQDIRHRPILDCSTENIHLDGISQGHLKVRDFTAPIAVPRTDLSRMGGEARRVQADTLWRREIPSQRDAGLFTLLGGGPAYLCQRGCVYANVYADLGLS